MLTIKAQVKCLLIHAAKGPDYGQYLDNRAAFHKDEFDTYYIFIGSA